ncbi:MAG: DUF2199 domain-containing protein [Planctomycetia bacterium]
MKAWHCAICNEVHDELPMHYVAPAPSMWFTIPEAERERRCLLSSDQCVIDDQNYFIVGNLELPVVGSEEWFSWDVWVSLSERNFARTREQWDQAGRESEPPYFGWVSTTVPGYPATLNLKSMVHTREVGRRPWVELEPTDHPLAVEQRQGITLARIQEIAERLLHG